MEIFWLVVVFIFGSMVGSFLNVCIYRLPRDRSPWRPARSYCPRCHEMIEWYDNIPLVSWFILHGHCRQCGSYISARYVLVEFLTAALFVLVYWVVYAQRGETIPVLIIYLALTAYLIVCSFIDLELRIIPNTLTIGGMLFAPIISVMVPALHDNAAMGRFWLGSDSVLGPLAASLVGMIVGAGSIYASGLLGKFLFRKEAMGFGDVKFMAALGGLLGWLPITLVFFLAPVLGSVIGVIYMLRTRDHHIPYGPFLSAAALVVMLWGGKILTWIGITQLYLTP